MDTRICIYGKRLVIGAAFREVGKNPVKDTLQDRSIHSSCADNNSIVEDIGSIIREPFPDIDIHKHGGTVFAGRSEGTLESR